MELGGHAPVIVYPDFDPVAAAKIGYYKIPQLWSGLYFTLKVLCSSFHHRTFCQSFVEVAKNLNREWSRWRGYN